VGSFAIRILSCTMYRGDSPIAGWLRIGEYITIESTPPP